MFVCVRVADGGVAVVHGGVARSLDVGDRRYRLCVGADASFFFLFFRCRRRDAAILTSDRAARLREREKNFENSRTTKVFSFFGVLFWCTCKFPVGILSMCACVYAYFLQLYSCLSMLFGE